ncbi:MAG: nucleotide exchange factor GrpE [Candidatus Promineifilaceae bacterium]
MIEERENEIIDEALAAAAEMAEEDGQPAESLAEQLAAAEAKAAEYLDGWQRARAEFANARRRLEREQAEAGRNAAIGFAQQLLPILDDFDRVLENVPPAVAAEPWYQGVLLVQRKLHAILDGLGVERIAALGEPFDPNLHEALAAKPAEDADSGMVVEEVRSGYRLGDRVIRPSLVNVAN